MRKLTPAGKFWLSYLAILGAVAVVTVTLSGCASQSLLKQAETTYGSFAQAERIGAVVVSSPTYTDNIKLQIQKADAAAKPVADALYAAILNCRASSDQCKGVQGALSAATTAIASFSGLPVITNLAVPVTP